MIFLSLHEFIESDRVQLLVDSDTIKGLGIVHCDHGLFVSKNVTQTVKGAGVIICKRKGTLGSSLW
jgi:hypothetical protein